MELFLFNLESVFLEAIPFLALGFVIAGLLRAFVSNDLIAKHLGKETWYSPIKAALIGAPIPLCSCSVIPVATGLRRSGSGKGALSSFLISAPETGADSLSISYAMLGPIMLVARLISSLATAILTAWTIVFVTRGEPMNKLEDEGIKSCYSCKAKQNGRNNSIFDKFIAGQRYAFTTLLDDSFKMILVALIITVILNTYVPSDFLTEYGDGILAMIIMAVVGFPMYICASASTPVAAGFIAIGVSPGAALVFMLAGPASNIATIGVVGRLISKRAALIYVICITVLSIVSGLTLNWLVDIYNWDITSQISEETILPKTFSYAVTIYVFLSSVKSLRPYLGLVKREKKQLKSCCRFN